MSLLGLLLLLIPTVLRAEKTSSSTSHNASLEIVGLYYRQLSYSGISDRSEFKAPSCLQIRPADPHKQQYRVDIYAVGPDGIHGCVLKNALARRVGLNLLIAKTDFDERPSASSREEDLLRIEILPEKFAVHLLSSPAHSVCGLMSQGLFDYLSFPRIPVSLVQQPGILSKCARYFNE